MPPKYLELVFNRPLEGSLTYLLPEDSADSAAAKAVDAAAKSKSAASADSAAFGRRVHAVLGKKRLTAYVVGESESRPDLPPHVQCRPIEKFIDQEAVFTHDLL
ncbi:MAG: hypothetical protein ACR2PY_02790, partial [Salinispira sp.]